MATQPSINDDWLRLPVRPRERLEGLSRTTILEKIYSGDIKSAVIKKKGSRKGIRLVSRKSLLAYLESCVEHHGSEREKFSDASGKTQ